MDELSPLEQLGHRPSYEGGDEDGMGIASSEGSIRVVSGSGFRYVVPFPYRLHKMLSDVEARGDASVVSFMPDGLHFKVHNPQRFVEEIIPKAFKQRSMKSFQRQLHLYGFQRVQDGPNKGAYWHENFVKNDRDLCLTISRIKAPKRRMGSQTKSSTSKKSLTKGAQNLHVGQMMLGKHPVPLNPSFRPRSHTTLSYSLGKSGGRLGQNNAVSNNSSRVISKSSQSQGNELETYQWLLNAGVPVSAFDPVALNDRQAASKINNSELLECADEITSLFSAATPSASPSRGTRVAEASATLEATIPLLSSFQNAYSNSSTTTESIKEDLPLPVSPSIHSSDESLAIPDLFGDGSLPDIGNDNWALW